MWSDLVLWLGWRSSRWIDLYTLAGRTRNRLDRLLRPLHRDLLRVFYRSAFYQNVTF